MNPAIVPAEPAGATLMRTLFSIGFLARFSYALARNPVLPLFAVALGAGPEGIGLAVGISTVTGILFKMPSGALSDVIGRRRTMLAGLVVFGLMPFAYLFITHYAALSWCASSMAWPLPSMVRWPWRWWPILPGHVRARC